LIRTVLTNSSATAYALTKSGLAIGAAFLGGVVVSIAIGWSALNNTHSLNSENRRLVSRLENVVMYQKTQISEAREANCKLKLYDVLSGRAGTILFKKAKVINKTFEEGINHTLEVVESIPAKKNCTAIFIESKGKKKKQIGGLTPSDIKNANIVLGEILEEPRAQRHNESKAQKKFEHKKFTNHNAFRLHRGAHKKKVPSVITSPPAPIVISAPTQTASSPVTAESSKHEKREEKKEERENIKQEKKNEKCAAEVSVGNRIGLEQELKICY
jgi:hypothetical protein